MANGYDDAGSNALVPGFKFSDIGAGATPYFGVTMDPAVKNDLMQPITPQTDPDADFSINDISKQTNIGTRYGTYEKPPQGMIIHHTGPGFSTAENLGKFFYNSYKGPGNSGVASNFTIDRDGKIYQLLPDGARGQHIMPGRGAGQGLANSNVEGVEIMANDDKDVTPQQQRAAAYLVAQRAAKYGWADPAKVVYGHGEVNPGHKEPDEGMTVTNGIRNGTLALPTVPTQSVQAPTGPTPLSTRSSTNQLGGGVPVPADISPFLNYWADYHNLDRDIFSRMVGFESGGFKKDARGTSGEIGLGQLIPDTAREMGLKVGDGIDERFDVNKNLMASAQYLRKMLDDPRVNGDYRKALMLYNSGPNPKEPFKNVGYADAVLKGATPPAVAGPGPTSPGRHYGYKAGDVPPGQEGPIRYAVGNPVEDLIPQPGPMPPDINALIPPQTAKPGDATPKAIQDAVAAANAQDQAIRRSLLLAQLQQAFASQTKGKPALSGYDPGKVQEATVPEIRPPAYSASIGGEFPRTPSSTVPSRPLTRTRDIEFRPVGGGIRGPLTFTPVSHDPFKRSPGGR